jgi:hypothetical protein
LGNKNLAKDYELGNGSNEMERVCKRSKCISKREKMDMAIKLE